MALLNVRNVSRHYTLRSGFWDRVVRRRPPAVLKAVDDVSFEVAPGEVLGIVGESGSGKTTTCLMVADLVSPTSGSIVFDGTDVTRREAALRRRFRSKVQIVFQDPYESLNPRMRVVDLVAEGPRALKLWPEEETRRRAMAMLERVGLHPAAYCDRFPHQMSGGERQRVGIASALVMEPKLVIADEPLSMLDVSIRAGIVDLLARLSEQIGFSAIYVSHDLSVLSQIADRLMVMYLGQVVEIGPTREVVTAPRHHYTRALIEAVPVPDPSWRRRPSRLRDAIAEPVGASDACRFAPRCPAATDLCRTQRAGETSSSAGHRFHCHHPVSQ
ncbi:MAG: oligopeptide/dipeptide ABC transporter ATP-binding protein [Parvibaculaceae bacterium]